MARPADHPDADGEGRRIRGRTLSERQRERRDAMVAAGYDLIGTRGFANTKIEDVCRRAGVSTRSFYEEFEDRQDLLVTIGEELVAAVFAAWSGPVTATSDDGGDAGRDTVLRARVANVVGLFADDPRLARVAFVEAVGLSPAHEARRRSLLRVFPAWLEAYMKGRLDDAGVPARRQRSMAIAAFAGAYELVATWALEPEADRADADELVDDIVAVGASIFRTA